MGIPFFENWDPQPGDVIGLAVSGHAIFGHSTFQERTNIVWIRVPDYNDPDAGGLVPIIGVTSSNQIPSKTSSTP